MAFYDANSAIQPVNALQAFMGGAQAGQAMQDLRRKRAQEAQDEEIRNGLMQFYRQAQPERRMVDASAPNPIESLMSAQRPSLEPMTNSPMAVPRVGNAAYQAMTAPQLQTPTLTERVIPAQAGGFDAQGAADYLASRGEFEQAGALGKLSGIGAEGPSAFASILWKDGQPYQLTNTPGVLAPLGAGFDAPTQVINLDDRAIVAPKQGGGAPIATYKKGVSAESQYVQGSQDRRQERGAQLEVQVTGDKKRIEAAVDREGNVTEQLRDAENAIADLNTLDGALSGLPSPAELKIEAVKGFVGRADPKIQEALGTAKFVSGRMLKYVERLPGAATDKDREVFMASAGVLTNEELPVAQRIAAARAAKGAYQRLVNKYGNKPEQPSQPAAVKPTSGGQPSGVGKAALWLKTRNIKTQDDARKAVQELTRQGWTRPQIEQALDQAGL